MSFLFNSANLFCYMTNVNRLGYIWKVLEEHFHSKVGTHLAIVEGIYIA